MQRGLPRESFEQNEVDGYHAGRPQEPSGARSNPPEAVGHGVPPRDVQEEEGGEERVDSPEESTTLPGGNTSKPNGNTKQSGVCTCGSRPGWLEGGAGVTGPTAQQRRLGASRPLQSGHSGEVREGAHLVQRLVSVLVGYAVRWLPTTLAALQPEQRSLEGPEAPA